MTRKMSLSMETRTKTSLFSCAMLEIILMLSLVLLYPQIDTIVKLIAMRSAAPPNMIVDIGASTAASSGSVIFNMSTIISDNETASAAVSDCLKNLPAKEAFLRKLIICMSRHTDKAMASAVIKYAI